MCPYPANAERSPSGIKCRRCRFHCHWDVVAQHPLCATTRVVLRLRTYSGGSPQFAYSNSRTAALALKASVFENSDGRSRSRARKLVTRMLNWSWIPAGGTADSIIDRISNCRSSQGASSWTKYRSDRLAQKSITTAMSSCSSGASDRWVFSSVDAVEPGMRGPVVSAEFERVDRY